jgi:hypothetical protein
MQVYQQRNIQFLETVAAQQEQLHQRAQWSEALQAAWTSVARAEAVLHPKNAGLEPMAHQAVNAYGDNSIPGNIAILEDSNDDDLQCSGTVPEATPDRRNNMLLTDL